MKYLLTLLTTLLLAPLAALNAAEPADTSIRSPELMFKRGDFVAMGGDSITYMSRYSLLVEMYLLAARPDLDLRVMKIQRWCGGSADLYARETLEQELIPAKPNVFTICFGMNDGGGTKPNPETTRRYAAALTQIVERNKANGINTVLCSPGVVDEFSYENVTLAAAAFNAANGTPSTNNEAANNAPAAVYNSTLAGLRDAARGVAESHKMPFADIHDAMLRVMQDAKAGYGTTWPPRMSLRRPERRAILCDDGIHPDTAAHIPMAYAVLRAMGFDGDIGSITLDWTNGKAAADSAQSVKVVSKGRLDVESQRLPLCFFDDSAMSGGYPSVPCRYVLQHCPFNQDLNRYRLQVRGLPNQPIRVTWGDRSLFFTREQLENGINLAAEFPENPFCPTMRTLDAAVWKKQVYERRLFEILNVAIWKDHFSGRKPEQRREELRKSLEGFSAWAKEEFSTNHEFLEACETIRVRALDKDEDVPLAELARIRQILLERQGEYHRKARELVKPVRHSITVEPVSSGR